LPSRAGFDPGKQTLKVPALKTAAWLLALALLGAVVADLAWQRSFHAVAWPDECIYLVGARNLVERGSLDTNFYLTHSLLVRGYPHRDVHMPGYVLALAPFVRALGATLTAGVTLNLLLFLVSIPLAFLVARAVLPDGPGPLIAAALFTLLPPFPGYLYVVYPELAVAFVFLAGLAWLLRGRGAIHAPLAGVLFGLGALFRETLLLALPLYLVRLPRRQLLRGFAPAAMGTLLLVVAPLSRNRAVHPNALYPSLVQEALRSDSPLISLFSVVGGNVAANLRLAGQARPLQNAEDLTLLVVALLGLAPLAAWPWLGPAARRLAGATLVSLGLLTGAVLAVYVVRERGGVWGGVRAYMCWAPLLLCFALAPVMRARALLARAALVAALAAAFLHVDQRHLYSFFRYKTTNHEDQERQARTIERYVDPFQPRRLVARNYLYGLAHYPVEIVWSLPRDRHELIRLERTLPYDFLVIHRINPLRRALIHNPHYRRLNKDDKGAELLIWRRLY
jgi:hypothetical protein